MVRKALLEFENAPTAYLWLSLVAALSDMSLFLSGQNLLLFTPYPGADPEVTSTDNTSATQGFDRNMMPNAKIYTIGLKVNF